MQRRDSAASGGILHRTATRLGARVVALVRLRPAFAFALIALAIFVLAALTILLVPLGEGTAQEVKALVQGSLIAVILAPVLYFSGLVPLRSHVEQQIRAEERFEDVAANAQEWIWEVDEDGLYTYASPVVEKILGFPPEDVVGKKHFYDLFHPDDREALKSAAFEVFGRRESFREFPNRNVHRDGREIWLHTSGVPIIDDDGRFAGYRGADSDVTERLMAEQERERLSRELQEALQEEIHTLRGILPICASCKKIRDDDGFWQKVEVYIHDRTDAQFSHGLCPDCLREAEKELQR